MKYTACYSFFLSMLTNCWNEWTMRDIQLKTVENMSTKMLDI